MTQRDQSSNILTVEELTFPGETREQACARLGLDGEWVLRSACMTLAENMERHRGKAPDGDTGALQAAAGDLFLAGVLYGYRLER